MGILKVMAVPFISSVAILSFALNDQGLKGKEHRDSRLVIILSFLAICLISIMSSIPFVLG